MVSNKEMSRRGSAPGRGAGNCGELENYRGATHEFSAPKLILQSSQPSRVVQFPQQPRKETGDIDQSLSRDDQRKRVDEILGQLEYTMTGKRVMNKDDARELHRKRIQRELDNRNRL